nr:MAG TPA: hypothetical protein [Caudoviricetes sp.]
MFGWKTYIFIYINYLHDLWKFKRYARAHFWKFAILFIILKYLNNKIILSLILV